MSDQSNAGSTFEPVKLGEVRPSQLIHTYGTGSVLELPNFSVIVPGLDGNIHQGDPWHTRQRDTVVHEEAIVNIPAAWAMAELVIARSLIANWGDLRVRLVATPELTAHPDRLVHGSDSLIHGTETLIYG